MNIFDFVKIFRKAKNDYFADKNNARKCIDNYKILEKQLFDKYLETKTLLNILSKNYFLYPKEWRIYLDNVTRLIRYGTVDINELNKDNDFSQANPDKQENDYLTTYLTRYNYVDKLYQLYYLLKANRRFCESYIYNKNYQAVMQLYNEDIDLLLKEENKRVFSSPNVFNIN